MHRVTEQRWAGFFWILLSAALTFQLIAFVSPAWLKIFINFEKHYVEKKSTDRKVTTPRTTGSNNVTFTPYDKNITELSNSTNMTDSSNLMASVDLSNETESFNSTNATTTTTSTTTTTTTTTTTPVPMPPLKIPVNQDYSLWYMTQCHVDTWTCETLTYYHIDFMDESYDLAKFKDPKHWFLDRTNLFLNGVELRFDYSQISKNQGLYTVGLIACAIAWWLVYRHRKRLRKKNFDKLTNTRLIVAAVASFFSGLFVLIPVGHFGNMGDQLRMLAKDYPQDVAVHKPIGLGFGAAGGTFAMFTGLIIALRLVLRGYCPDCVNVPQQDEIAMTERGNQVEGVEKCNS